MAKKFATKFSSATSNHKYCEEARDRTLEKMSKDGFELFSTVMNDSLIVDTFVKDDDNFSD